MTNYLKSTQNKGFNLVKMIVGGVDPITQNAWDPGIYVKIEDAQIGNPVHFPPDYLTNDSTSQAINSLYGKLDRKIWLKGFMRDVYWGEMETSPGVFDFSELDPYFAVVGGLSRPTGANKKILLQIPLKTFGMTNVDKNVPADLLISKGTPYPDGSIRYNRLWAYTRFNGSTPEGYHLNSYQFRNGLTGNDLAGAPIYTLRDRLYAFCQAIHDRYHDNPVFAGIVINEPGSTTPYNGFVSTNSRDNYFAGRLAFLRKLKTIFTKHLVAENCNFDTTWVNDMTLPGGHCLTDKIAYANPNYHLGLNLKAPYNARSYLAGEVPIINQCQGLDMDSKTGFIKRDGTVPNDVYDWTPTPPGYGNPLTAIENPNVTKSGTTITVLTFDPPDGYWIVQRALWLKTNYFIVQHNFANVGNKNAPRFNFADFVTYMDSSPYANDPAGGMITTRPTFIAS